MGFPSPPRGPGEEQQADVLEPILTFYDRFAKENATNPQLQLEAGRAHRRVGEVHAMRGNADKAAVSFRRAADLLEGYRRAFPDDRPARAELVQVYLASPQETFPDYERRLSWSLGAARALPPGEARPHLASAVALKLGWLRERNGDRAGAERLYREAVAELKAEPDRQDAFPFVPGELVLARSLLASLLANTSRPQEARRLLEESLAEFRTRGDRQRTGGRGPGFGPPPELMAPTHRLLATVCEQLGDGPAAEAHRAEAERLSQAFGKGMNQRKKD
jgi:tetratricopeptide (TPR) repeat protein